MIRVLKQQGLGVLLLAALLHACSSDEPRDTQQPQQPQQWSVSIPVGSGATRSVYSSDGGTTLKSMWNANQEVKAYNGSTKVGDLEASENLTGGTTNVTGTITGTYTAGSSTLTLYSPAKLSSATYAEYATQDGTISGANGISSKDYVTATVNVTAVDASRGLLSTSYATFQRLQSFTQFTFSEAVKTVKISASGMDDITVTASGDQNVFYVALPLEGSVSYTFACTTNGGVEYRGTVTLNLTHGKYYKTSIGIAPGVGVTNTSNWTYTSEESDIDIYF